MNILCIAIMLTMSLSNPPETKMEVTKHEQAFEDWGMDRHFDEEYYEAVKYMKIYKKRMSMGSACKLAKMTARIEMALRGRDEEGNWLFGNRFLKD